MSFGKHLSLCFWCNTSVCCTKFLLLHPLLKFLQFFLWQRISPTFYKLHRRPLHQLSCREYHRDKQNQCYFHSEILFINMCTLCDNPWGIGDDFINPFTLSAHRYSFFFSTDCWTFIRLQLPLYISMGSWSQTPAMSQIFLLGKASLHCLNILAWPIWKESKTPSA